MNRIFEAYNKHNSVLLVILVAPIVFYFYELSSFSMTYDELRRVSRSFVDPGWIQQGRWGMYYLTKIYSSNPVFPVVGIYLSLVLSSIVAAILLLVGFPKTNKLNLILFVLLFISYPSIYYLYDFSTISFVVGPIFILSLLTTLGFAHRNLNVNLLSVLALVLSLSLYQASLSLTITMMIVFRFFKEDQGSYQDIIKQFLLLIIGLVLYYISIDFFLYLHNFNNSGYISEFVRFELGVSYVYELFSKFITKIFSYYLYNEEIYLVNNHAIVLLTFVGMCIFTSLSYKKSNMALWLIISIGFVLSPFILNLLSVDGLPTRALLALPLSISFSAFLVLHYTEKVNKSIYLLTIVLSFVALIFNFISLTKLSFISSNSWEADKRIAQMMVSRVYDDEHYEDALSSNGGYIKTHLVGYREKDENQFNREMENVGKSFFKWGANELLNVVTLFSTLGYDEFRFADFSYVRPHLSKIRSMPSWPSKGSIKFFGNTLVIKVSDYTEAQWNLLCRNDDGSLLLESSCKIRFNPQSIPFTILDENKGENFQVTELFNSRTQLFSNVINMESEATSPILIPRNQDPQLILPSISTDSHRLALHIQGLYENEDFIDLYFKNNGSDNYVYYNVIRMYVAKGIFNTVVVLPRGLFLDGLRIDPTTRVEPIKNFSIQVTTYE